MDPLSAAASGISVISLAIQLANGIKTLHEFWSSVRDAPSDIKEIIDDLQCLGSLLNEIANGGNHSVTLVLALETCEGKVKTLFNIVRRLEPNFHKSSNTRVRIWNSVKGTLKKNRIKECRESLQETKITLLLAMMRRGHVLPAYPGLPNPIEAPNLNMNITDSEGKRIDIKPDIPERIACEMTAPEVKASMETALQSAAHSAAENLFGSGTLGQIMNDTVARVTTIQSTYHGSYRPNSSSSSNSASSTTEETKQLRLKKARVCHHTTSTGVLFGKVWVRTTTVRVGKLKAASKESMEIVTSFVFYPSRWLTKMGLGRGMEANLSTSSGGWQFNFNPVRAVPDNSLIFEFCNQGNLKAVQQLITRGDASVRDTSSKGWNPLHFAAEAANVELCEYLISAGADKTALVYKGPSEDTLSPITIFVETTRKLSAERKIQMLRLFHECLDLSEPDSDGWVIIGRLVQCYNKENVSVLANSVNWVLQCVPTDGIAQMGHQTVWHGFQHATRSLLVHEYQNDMFLSLLGMERNYGEPEELSRIEAIAHWLAISVCNRHLWPMLREVGAFLRINGYDFVNRPIVPPAEFARTVPLLYDAWVKALPDTIENERDLLAVEFSNLLLKIGMDRKTLLESIWKPVKIVNTAGQQEGMRCSACGDDYNHLGIGLVDPLWLAFEQCTSIKHRHNCICSTIIPKPTAQDASSSNASETFVEENRKFSIPGEFHFAGLNLNEQEEKSKECEAGPLDPAPYQDYAQDIPPANYPTSRREFDDEIDDKDDEDLASSGWSWTAECEDLVRSKATSKPPDPFELLATSLYITAGRNLVGEYKLGEKLCGTCFLKREGFIGKDGIDSEDQYIPPPDTWCVDEGDDGLEIES